MTKQQLKSEIQKALDNVPEKVLQDILNYLKEIEHKSADEIETAYFIRRILDEDSRLLKRLAE